MKRCGSENPITKLTSQTTEIVTRSADGVVERTLRSEAPTMRRWMALRRELAKDRRALVRFAIRITGFVPLLWQLDPLIAGDTKIDGGVIHKAALGGFGAGKSDWLAFELFCMVLANPGCRFLAAAPTYDQVEGILIPKYQRLVDAAASRGYRLSWRGVGVSSLVDNLTCGGRVYFRSYAKVSNLLGFEFAGGALEELDTVLRPREVWDTVHSRIRQPGAAWRQLIVATTPDQGEAGVAGIWKAARREGDKRLWYWKRATALDNPHLTPSPEAYVDGLVQTMSRREADVKVFAKVLRPSTAVYSEYATQHVRRWRYDPALPYDLALDGGDQWPHYLWIQRHPQGWAVVFDEYYPDDLPRDHHRAEVERRCAMLRKPPQTVVMDRALKDDRTWAFRTWSGAFVTWCKSAREQSVQDGIDAVRRLLDPVVGEPKLYVAEHLTGKHDGRGIDRCLKRYRYKMQSDGHVSPEPYKDNVHDHGADALRYWSVMVGVDGVAGSAMVPFASASRGAGRSRYSR